MNYAIPLLAVPLLLGCPPVPKDRLVAKDEWVLDSTDGQAIRTLLDGVNAKRMGKERFVVVIHYSDTFFVKLTVMSARTIAWFRYAPGDQSVTVNYLSFPMYEKGRDLFARLNKFRPAPEDIKKSLESRNQFDSFLKEIVQNKGIIGIENVKQIDVPLPVGLHDDALLNEMCKYKPSRFYTENGIPMIRASFGSGDVHYWGIKTSKCEMVHGTSDFMLYDHKINRKIESEILWPIQCAILERETPDDWGEDYRKWQEDLPRISKEQQEIREMHRQKEQGTERTE